MFFLHSAKRTKKQTGLRPATHGAKPMRKGFLQNSKASAFNRFCANPNKAATAWRVLCRCERHGLQQTQEPRLSKRLDSCKLTVGEVCENSIVHVNGVCSNFFAFSVQPQVPLDARRAKGSRTDTLSFCLN